MHINEIMRILSLILPIIVLFSAILLLPFIALSRFFFKKYEKFYNAFILGLLSMLALNLAYASSLLGNMLIYKLFEIASFLLFITSTMVIIKNSASIFILGEVNKRLEKEVNEKSKELKEREKELERKISELTDAKKAMFHILKDLNEKSTELESLNKFLLALHEIDHEIIRGASLNTVLKSVRGIIEENLGLKLAIALIKEDRIHFYPEKTEKRKEIKDRLLEAIKSGGNIILDSFAVFPLLYRKEAIGAIAFESKEEIEKKLIKSLEIFSTQFAIAIENAKLMEENKRAYEELKSLDELKGNIISNVSHELRTPLTIAKLSIELASEQIEDEKIKSLLRKAIKAFKRQNEIIENLLAASSFYAGRVKLEQSYFYLPDVINEILSELSEHAKAKNISLIKQLKKIEIYGDRAKIKRAIKNIVDNAIKFNKKHGRVIIKTAKSKNKIKISIKDTGIGISEEDIPKIFRPLYQSDSSATRAYGGTGMGLATAKMLIELHGGEIKVKSRVSKGSEFIIELPHR